MLSKNEAKYIQSLHHKKQRHNDGLFIAEGSKIVEELLQSDYEIYKVFALDTWKQPKTSKPFPVTPVSEIDLQKITALQTANTVLAVAKQKEQINEPILKGKLSLVLDGIQDPGNLGTMIRIADWFGITQIICSEDTAELYNPKVIQSTMGSFTRVNVWYKDLPAFMEQVNVPIFGALLKGENVFEMNKPKEGILIIGNEGKGISKDVLTTITNPITIPRFGKAESLNAAVATGIILSHIV